MSVDPNATLRKSIEDRNRFTRNCKFPRQRYTREVEGREQCTYRPNYAIVDTALLVLGSNAALSSELFQLWREVTAQ